MVGVICAAITSCLSANQIDSQHTPLVVSWFCSHQVVRVASWSRIEAITIPYGFHAMLMGGKRGEGASPPSPPPSPTSGHPTISAALSPPLMSAKLALSPKSGGAHPILSLQSVLQKSMVRSGNSMPVSVKVYYGQGAAIEIRRFIFRPDLLQQRSVPSGAATPGPINHHHQQYGGPSSSGYPPTALSPTSQCAYQTLVEKIKSLYNGLNLQQVHLCWKGDQH